MKKTTLRLLLLLLWAGMGATAAPLTIDSSTLIVATRQGLLRGSVQDSIYSWKGIPYAKAPEGDLRFRAPQPPVSWTGIKDATKFGPAAPQNRRITKQPNGRGEDCLSLNIWSPVPDGKTRPVMFWIHGGGFLVGTGSSPLYDGANLAHNGDLIVVTINYRLGPLGFLYFGDIRGDQQGFEDNLGIRDQIAALQWVKENIAAFGGDPDAVTIFGESAGAISVQTLMGTPSVRGLFKRAIVESGMAESLWRPKTATELTLRYLKMLKVSPDHLSDLKALNADTLIDVMDRLISELMHEPTTVKILEPTIDGKLIPSDLMSAIASGSASGIDLMIGTNKDESTLLALKRIGITPRNAAELAPYLANIEPEARQRLIATYKNYPHRKGVYEMTTDGIFAMPAIRFSELQTAHAATYMYRFDWSSAPLRMVGLRACHGLELPFVFGNTESGPGRTFTILSNRKTVRRISRQMQQSWINFARYGNPDPSGTRAWQRYEPTVRSTMIFDRTTSAMPDPKSEHRQVWSGLSIFRK